MKTWRRHFLCIFAIALTMSTNVYNDLRAQSPLPFQSAKWIWHGSPNADAGGSPRFFRCSFRLPDQPKAAELRITVDNRYTAYINGKKVGEDGAWESVESYDVAKYLQKGSNVLAFAAKNDGGPAGAIAWLRMRVGGTQRIIATDSNTRTSDVGPKGWNIVDFNDSRWSKAYVLGGPSIGPWNILGRTGSGAPGQPGTSRAADPKIKEPLSPQQQLRHFILPKGFEIELVAAEPLLINPITMTIDDLGRIYVSESHTYRYGPGRSPVKPFKNPIIRLDPQPNGKGYRRVLVADGFDEPVMGLAIRGNQLWCTACDKLYRFDLQQNGKAVNRKTLLIDRNKAWNPFGMFVLEWGPDGLLYMSVGNHNIDIRSVDEKGKPVAAPKMSGRGSSGIVIRMKPDGSDLERLVHGLRVPYSFEYDPFGRLWLLSNGQGNPNRFVRVIDGVDYHCYSRNVSQHWLQGQHPLAPPCFELPPGARTQLIRYYGSAYPKDCQGMLLLDNWGQHGFAGGNRSVFRYKTDVRDNIVEKDAFVSCADPRFRCSHIIVDHDGNLLVADWYGRDDESDLTGRIWRVKYRGAAPVPTVKHSLGAPQWKNDDYVVSALGSPHHRIREATMRRLCKSGEAVVGKLAEHASTAKEPLGAANALWALLRIGTPSAKKAITAGATHADWRIRRLTINILRKHGLPNAAHVATMLANDKEPAVRVEAALAHRDSPTIRSQLMKALRIGAADDAHLRYEAAWHLARHADEGTFDELLRDKDENIRLSGLLAIDIACFEQFPTHSLASATLNRRLATPGSLDINLLLDIATTNPNANAAKGLKQLIVSPTTSVAAKARGLLALRSIARNVSDSLLAKVGTHLLQAVEKGEVRLRSNSDWLLLLRLMESDGPSEFAVGQIASLSGHRDAKVRGAALSLARKFGHAAAPLSEILWQRLRNPKLSVERRLEIIGTLTKIETKTSVKDWQSLLADSNAAIRADAVRSWRAFAGNSSLVNALVRASEKLTERDPGIEEDLGAVLRHLKVDAAIVKELPSPETDKIKLAERTKSAIAAMPAKRRKTAALLGWRVFERSACIKCHTTVTENTPRAPSLKDIGKTQKIDYIVESVLHPSKIIKTGFETELLVTKLGKVINGLVREEGDSLRIYEADREFVLTKTMIKKRAITKQSLMPDGLESQMSRAEFVDLVAYLLSLKK